VALPVATFDHRRQRCTPAAAAAGRVSIAPPGRMARGRDLAPIGRIFHVPLHRTRESTDVR